MPERHLLQTLHRPPAARRSCALRPRARPRPAVSGCPALGDLRGLQDLRRRNGAPRPGGDRRRLRLRSKLCVLQPADLRRAPFRAAPTGGGGFQHRHNPEHGRAHPRALAGPHPPARHIGRALVADPAAAAVRRSGRALPRDLLLGLVLHDAGAHRERSDRPRAQHSRQLRLPGRDGRAHPQRQPDVLSEPQPAPVLRRHGRALRRGDGHHAGPRLPRRARGGARVLDGRRGASRTRGGRGGFYDVRWKSGERVTDRPTIAAAAALYFGLATPEQGRAVAARLERDFLKPGGFVPTLITSGQQWDAPNGWPPLEWLAIEGVRRYGRADLAAAAHDRWLALNRQTYRATGKMTEKYDVADLTRRAGGGEYPTQDGFGWTNGVALALAAKPR